jgi:signal transduction histidine kinase
MRRDRFISILVLTYGFSTLSAYHAYPAPKVGILDLRKVEWNDQSILDLNGEWIFYWEKLLDPENIQQHRDTGIPVTVPSYWSSYTIDGESLPGSGYGTYRLQILLPEGQHHPICIDIPLFDVAFKFYLNDRLIGQNGEVGRSREEEQPWYEPGIFCYIPHQDTLQLLIQVSNFHHRRGGYWQSVVIGSSDKVQDRKERKRMFNYSTIGVLFFFFIFFMIFWSFSRKQVLMLLFSLATMGILMRSVNTGLYFSNFFVDTSWSWQIRMEYLGSYLAQIFGMIFLHKMFPRRYMNRIIWANTILVGLASISLFILPVHIFSYEMLVYQPLLVLFLAHYLIISLVGTLKRKIMDAVFFGSLSFFILTLVNDILLANSAGSVSSNYMSQVSFQLFIFAMAVMVILQWISNDSARKQLESSLLFKNRVLSVIAHDLKNPIASIAQFSELLVSKPEISSRSHVRNSLRESSQAALNLLDNLLYWGRSESESLSIAPTQIDIKELVNDVIALFQYMALQKELDFSSDVKTRLKAYADPVLIKIVLRNLVSNAIKFTRKGGMVHIRAWEEGDTIYCSVADTGIGMAAEYLERFKTDGYLQSSSGTDQEIGTGLGLQLIKDMLEKNNGTLDIESKSEKGSTFTFTLPVKNEEKDENESYQE